MAALGSRRPPPPGGGSRRPADRSSRQTRYARAAKRKRNQRIGVLVGALALATALIGSRLAFQDAPTSAAAQNTPRASAAAASSTSLAPTGAPTTSSAPATASAMTMTCPSGGGATALFGHQITVPEPYKVAITYGDGDQYTNDNAHLGAVFSHTYKKAGTYAVKAVLTAGSGQTAAANCTYTWGP